MKRVLDMFQHLKPISTLALSCILTWEFLLRLVIEISRHRTRIYVGHNIPKHFLQDLCAYAPYKIEQTNNVAISMSFRFFCFAPYAKP